MKVYTKIVVSFLSLTFVLALIWLCFEGSKFWILQTNEKLYGECISLDPSSYISIDLDTPSQHSYSYGDLETETFLSYIYNVPYVENTLPLQFDTQSLLQAAQSQLTLLQEQGVLSEGSYTLSSSPTARLYTNEQTSDIQNGNGFYTWQFTYDGTGSMKNVILEYSPDLNKVISIMAFSSITEPAFTQTGIAEEYGKCFAKYWNAPDTISIGSENCELESFSDDWFLSLAMKGKDAVQGS